MQETNNAGGRISRIIQVIDEIAFQTNILALNAAVEAARAGESVGMSSEGSAKLNQMAEAVTAITDSATRVRTLSKEVKLRSREQTRGMDRIVQPISRMERVTRKTAASEQLHSQANPRKS